MDSVLHDRYPRNKQMKFTSLLKDVVNKNFVVVLGDDDNPLCLQYSHHSNRSNLVEEILFLEFLLMHLCGSPLY